MKKYGTTARRAFATVMAAAGILAVPGTGFGWDFDSRQDELVTSGAFVGGLLQMATDGQGGCILLYHALSQLPNEPHQRRPYLQRIDFGGDLLWETPGLSVSGSTPYGGYPQILSDGEGGVFVVFQSPVSGESQGADIYLQRITHDGTFAWNPAAVQVCTAPKNQQHPLVVRDGQGGAIVIWRDGRHIQNPGSAPYSIYAQRINGDGEPQWENEGVLVTSAGSENKYLASDGAGGAYIAWTDQHPRVQHLNASGERLWEAEGRPVHSGTYSSEAVGLTSDEKGGLIVVWNDNRDMGSEFAVYAQRFSPDGLAVWTENGVEILGSGRSGNLYGNLLVSDGVGGAIIGWELDDLGGDTLLLQRISSAGNVLWGPWGIAASPERNLFETEFSLAPDGSGGVFAAWTDVRGCVPGDDYCQSTYKIYSQRIAPNGLKLWGETGTPVGTSSKNAFLPVIQESRRGDAIIAWVLADAEGGIDGAISMGRVPVTPHISERQSTRITSGVGSYGMAYDFQTGTIVASRYVPPGDTFTCPQPPGHAMGLYTYDYSAARFTQAVYRWKSIH